MERKTVDFAVKQNAFATLVLVRNLLKEGNFVAQSCKEREFVLALLEGNIRDMKIFYPDLIEWEKQDEQT